MQFALENSISSKPLISKQICIKIISIFYLQNRKKNNKKVYILFKQRKNNSKIHILLKNKISICLLFSILLSIYLVFYNFCNKILFER